MRNNDIQRLENKMKTFGVEVLNDHEILLYILNQWYPVEIAQLKAQLFWRQYSDLRQLQKLSTLENQLFFDKETDIMQFQVMCEFVRRIFKRPDLVLGQVCSSKKIGEVMVAKIGCLKQEVLYGVFLDTKNQIIHQAELFKGTLNQATVHPREICQCALYYSAARFILVHNHPSGIVTPSQHDLDFTQRMSKVGELIGINLLDHIIVGDHSYFSMREEQILR